MSKELRTAASNLIIPHSKFMEGLNKIKQGISMAEDNEPTILAVIGPSRGGKSSLLTHTMTLYKNSRDSEGFNSPILYIRTPAKPTQKSITYLILSQLKDPLCETRMPEYVMNERARKLMQNCGVKAIFLDEVQHFTERWKDKVVYEAADALKNLVEQTGILLVVAGTSQASALLYENEQFKRRTFGEIRLEKFDWHNPISRREFCGVMKGFCSGLPQFEMPPLHNEDIAERFWIASEGLIGLVGKILKQATWDACTKANEQGNETPERLEITMADLAVAYDRVKVSDANRINHNPFDMNISVHKPMTQNHAQPAPNTISAKKVNTKNLLAGVV